MRNVLALAIAGLALASLSGCIVAPARPAYYGGEPGYVAPAGGGYLAPPQLPPRRRRASSTWRPPTSRPARAGAGNTTRSTAGAGTIRSTAGTAAGTDARGARP